MICVSLNASYLMWSGTSAGSITKIYSRLRAGQVACSTDNPVLSWNSSLKVTPKLNSYRLNIFNVVPRIILRVWACSASSGPSNKFPGVIAWTSEPLMTYENLYSDHSSCITVILSLLVTHTSFRLGKIWHTHWNKFSKRSLACPPNPWWVW